MTGSAAADHMNWLTMANRYLIAVNILWTSPGYRPSNALLSPTLHLLAHGIELLLKANLIGMGHVPKRVGKDFGHHLMLLWRAEQNTELRKETYRRAILIYDEVPTIAHRPEGRRDDPVALLDDHLELLALLHSTDTDYALRYGGDERLEGPRAPFLALTFGEVAKQCLVDASTSAESTGSPGS